MAAKAALAGSVRFIHPSPGAEIPLLVDASAEHIGAVLQQRPHPAGPGVLLDEAGCHAGQILVKGVYTLDKYTTLFNRPESHTKNRQNMLVSIRLCQIVGLLYSRSPEIFK
jgi:hypothetical protein